MASSFPRTERIYIGPLLPSATARQKKRFPMGERGGVTPKIDLEPPYPAPHGLSASRRFGRAPRLPETRVLGQYRVNSDSRKRACNHLSLLAYFRRFFGLCTILLKQRISLGAPTSF